MIRGQLSSSSSSMWSTAQGLPQKCLIPSSVINSQWERLWAKLKENFFIIFFFLSRPTSFPGSLSSVGTGRREPWEQGCLKTFACDLVVVGKCWSLLDLKIKSFWLNFISLVFLYFIKASFFDFLQFYFFFLEYACVCF